MPLPVVFSYAGTGIAQSFVTPGFNPHYVAIWQEGAFGDGPLHRAKWLGDGVDNSFGMQDGFTLAGRITAFTANGFNIGTGGEVNTAGRTYHALVLPSDYAFGVRYAGDDAADRLIVTPWPAAWTLIFSTDEGARETHWRSLVTPDTIVSRRIGNGATAGFTPGIRVEAGGIRVRVNGDPLLNQAGFNYDLVAFRNVLNGALRYAGDAADPRNLAVGGGLEPAGSIVVRSDNVVGNMLSYSRPRTLPVNNARTVISGINQETNFITDESPGIVEIGNNSLNGVNARHVNNAGVTYEALVWGLAAPPEEGGFGLLRSASGVGRLRRRRDRLTV